MRTTFASYHLMVAIGMLFIALTLLASYLRWRGALFEQKWLLKIFVLMVGLAMVANQLGWVTAEVGRQPWTVHPRIERTAQGKPALDEQGFVKYRLEEGLRTRHAASEAVDAPQVLGSILVFSILYLLLGALWLFVLDRKIRRGPLPLGPSEATYGHGIIEAVAEREGQGVDRSLEKL